MRIKTIIATGLVAIAGVAAAAPAAQAAGKADTQVTIQGNEGEYFGYVKSDREQLCANNRKVKVYKMLGSSPNPGQDLKIGSDTSSPNGDGYMWNAGNTGYKKGKFYAKVGSTDYCKSDLSRVITR